MTGRKKKLLLSIRYKNIIAPQYVWKKNLFNISILYTSTPFTQSFLSKHSINKQIGNISTFSGLAQ